MGHDIGRSRTKRTTSVAWRTAHDLGHGLATRTPPQQARGEGYVPAALESPPRRRRGGRRRRRIAGAEPVRDELPAGAGLAARRRGAERVPQAAAPPRDAVLRVAAGQRLAAVAPGWAAGSSLSSSPTPRGAPPRHAAQRLAGGRARGQPPAGRASRRRRPPRRPAAAARRQRQKGDASQPAGEAAAGQGAARDVFEGSTPTARAPSRRPSWSRCAPRWGAS